MNPDLSHLRVTVVDLMGVFLPGVIWTILIATLQESVSQSSAGVSPISVAQELLAPGRSVGFYIVSSVLALIVGYVAKTVAIPPSEIELSAGAQTFDSSGADGASVAIVVDAACGDGES